MTPNLDSYSNRLLAEVNKYDSVEDWWEENVLTRVIRSMLLETLALAALIAAFCFLHNWMAMICCIVIVGYNTSSAFSRTSVALAHVTLLMAVQQNFQAGFEQGRAAASQEMDSPSPPLN